MPWRLTLAGGGLMAFAGLWDVWAGGGPKLATCCLLTTAANDTVRPPHDRMPVILPPAAWGAWLAPGLPAGDLRPPLRLYPGPMLAAPANPKVNTAGVEGPELLAA